jgi:hypothetical protein
MISARTVCFGSYYRKRALTTNLPWRSKELGETPLQSRPLTSKWCITSVCRETKMNMKKIITLTILIIASQAIAVFAGEPVVPTNSISECSKHMPQAWVILQGSSMDGVAALT